MTQEDKKIWYKSFILPREIQLTIQFIFGRRESPDIMPPTFYMNFTRALFNQSSLGLCPHVKLESAVLTGPCAVDVCTGPGEECVEYDGVAQCECPECTNGGVDPVCALVGSGVGTYLSACKAQRAACVLNLPYEILHEGNCGGECAAARGFGGWVWSSKLDLHKEFINRIQVSHRNSFLCLPYLAELGSFWKKGVHLI